MGCWEFPHFLRLAACCSEKTEGPLWDCVSISPDSLGLKLPLLGWNYHIADPAERTHLSKIGLNLNVLLFCFKVVCSLYGHNLSVWSCIVFCQHEESELKYTVQHSSSVNSLLIYAWINVLQPLTQGEVGIQLLNCRFST